MRTPRTLALALTSALAMAFSPALAGDQPRSEQVQIEIDVDASLEDKIRSIRSQAWSVCQPKVGSDYPSARNAVRSACQKQVVADVLAQLSAQAQLGQTDTQS